MENGPWLSLRESRHWRWDTGERDSPGACVSSSEEGLRLRSTAPPPSLLSLSTQETLTVLPGPSALQRPCESCADHPCPYLSCSQPPPAAHPSHPARPWKPRACLPQTCCPVCTSTSSSSKSSWGPGRVKEGNLTDSGGHAPSLPRYSCSFLVH